MRFDIDKINAPMYVYAAELFTSTFYKIKYFDPTTSTLSTVL
jgi:hypothetical protein